MNDTALQIELARLRAQHHVHDAVGILTETMPLLATMEQKTFVTAIVGELETLECRLENLKEIL
jgi:hypothetical protein